MKLHFGHKLSDLPSIFCLALLCLALVCALLPVSALAQTLPATNMPLVGTVTPEQLQAQKVESLKIAQEPFAQDFLPTISNPDLKPSLFRIALDAPAPATASAVTSSEQTIDVTLGLDPVLSTGVTLSATSGIPTGATPYYADVTWSHTGDYLVFSAITPGTHNYHLYIAAANGGPIGYGTGNKPIYVQQLTSGSNNERYPSLSPGDTSIVFCSDADTAGVYELAEANISNSTGTFLISDMAAVDSSFEARHPFYTGSTIYFSGRQAGQSGPFDIYALTLGGTGADSITRLTGGGVADNDNPVVTGVGQGWIAWDSNAAGFSYNASFLNSGFYLTATTLSTGGARNVFGSTLTGANEQALTVASGSGAYSNEHPQWSTDNPNSFVGIGVRDLFFDSNRPAQFGLPATKGSTHIYYFDGFDNNGLVSESVANAPALTEVNTSDPSGYTAGVTPSGDTNQFDDFWPTVSQLNGSYIAVAYLSDRYLIDHNYDNPLVPSSLHFATTVATADAQVTIGIQTTLAGTVATGAGATSLSVTNIDGSGSTPVFFPGQTIYIDQGTTTFESAVIQSVSAGNPATITLLAATTESHNPGAKIIAESTVLSAPVIAGATTLPVSTVEGFVVGETVQINGSESVIITGVPTSTTLTISPTVAGYNAGTTVTPTVDQEPSSVKTVASVAGAADEILVSRLEDVDPPALIRYSDSTNEVIHVFAGPLYDPVSGVTNYNPVSTPNQYVPAGQQATFVVRLSDRQTGVGQSWLQIKDPNSFSQNSTGLEHKVFSQTLSDQFHPIVNEATVPDLDTAAFSPNIWAGFDADGATAGYDGTNQLQLGNQVVVLNTNSTLTIGASAMSTSITVANGGAFFPGEQILIGRGTPQAEIDQISATNGNVLTVAALQNSHLSGAVVVQINAQAVLNSTVPPTGATFPQWSLPLKNAGGFNVGDIILLSTNGAVGEEAEIVQVSTDGKTLTVDKAIAEQPATRDYGMGLVGPQAYVVATGIVTTVFLIAHADFDPLGNEIDCEAINTSIPANNVNGVDVISALPSSYRVPDYFPGIDDAGTQFDTEMTRTQTTYPITNGVPAYWLKLAPLPPNLQDNNGGVLYYATWTTPSIGSDFYVDVVAEDASGGNLDPTAGENWQIYDNVWGFNTQSFHQNTHILVVNDYALPQRFFSRAGANGPMNLFGTESYWTDINNDIIDWQNYYVQTPQAQATLQQSGLAPTTVLPLIAQEIEEANNGTSARGKLVYQDVVNGGSNTGQDFFPPYTNGLGINSYIDGLMDVTQPVGTGVVNGTLLAASQQYDIWRILSRGPVPPSTLNGYGATTVSTPPDPFATSATAKPLTALSAPSCVIWLSPYSGDSFVGAGTITDPNTQATLEAFLNGGGRLHMEGKDIGYALTLDGTTPNVFYNQYLNNVPSTGGTVFTTDDVGDPTAAFLLTVANGVGDLISHDPWAPYGEEHNYWYPGNTMGLAIAETISQHNVIISNRFPNNVVADSRTDASQDCAGNNTYGSTSNEFQSFMDGFTPLSSTENELTGTTNHETLYAGSNGSMVSYSSFGMATISQEVINFPGTNVPTYVVVNQRSHLEHNIVCALRTGQIFGTVTTGPGATSFVPQAIVEAVPTIGTRVYTGESNTSGQYTIVGLPAGAYNMKVYAQGFAFQHSSTTTTIHGGDSGAYPVTISRAANGSLQVNVVDANSNGVQGATVSLSEVTGGTVPTPETTDTTGKVLFQNVETGSYTVTVTASGYTTASQAGVIISPAQLTAVTIQLTTVPTFIAGTVYVGPPPPTNPVVTIPGALVTLTNSAGVPFTDSTGAQISTTANAQGNYSFDLTGLSLATGTTVYVVASASGYSPNTPVLVGVLSGTSYNPINIPLLAQATLTVRAVDAVTQAGIPGVSISATGAQAFGPTNTDVNGNVIFAPATVGTYSVTALASSWQALGYVSVVSQSPANPVTVASKLNTTVTITLQPSIGSLTGKVTDASSGAALNGATVTITSGSTTYTATTNSSGVYSITNVKTGTYTASVVDLNYVTATLTGLVITNGITVTQNFQLTLGSIHQYPAGLQMISAPYDYSGQTLSSVLLGDYDGTDNAPNVIATWLPYESQYVKSPTTPCETLHAGIGYWARFGSTGGLLLHTGSTDTAGGVYTRIVLSPGWNMIGDPFTTPCPLASLNFYAANGGSPISFATASGPGGPNLVSPYLYTYDQATNSYTLVTTGGSSTASSELMPYAGYWIEAFTTCTLQYGTP